MYTGKDFGESQFNPVTLNGRQTGSSFKGDHARDRARRRLLAERPRQRRLARLANAARSTTGDLDCSGGHDDAHRRGRRVEQLRVRAHDLSLGPGHYGDDGAAAVVDMAGRLGIDTSKLSAVPVADARHVEHERARHGRGVLGVRQRRRPPRRRRSSPRSKAPTARSSTRPTPPGSGCCPSRSRAPRPRCSRDVITSGTGTGPPRPARRRQDGHDRRQQRRLVRRLHAAVHGGGVDGRLGGASPDEQRRRRPRHGRHATRREIWAAFMKAAHENLPVDRLHRARRGASGRASARIDEFGRG